MTSRKKSGTQDSISKLKTRPLERNIALTRLGLGAGAKIAMHSVANIFRGDTGRDEANREFYSRQARILADELGQLKGSVMKAGQMLSLYGQYFLPEEAVDILSGLQDDTPPVHWSVVAPVLERCIGKARLGELEIDHTPIAAASLGQAHRAWRKRDRQPLCVKIQYPGVADSIESDIKTLSRLLLLTRLTPKDMDLTPVFSEVREMLLREVDYHAERRFTDAFAAKLRDDQRFAVPKIFAEYSGDMVLTSSFEVGISVRDEQIGELSQARRNRLARAFLELFLKEFFDWRMLQSDPHFGNYRLRLDAAGEDRIVLLDFGATRIFEPAFVANYSDIVAGAMQGDAARVARGGVAIGLLKENFPEQVTQAFVELCALIVEPFNAADSPLTPPALLNAKGEYRWGASDLPMRSSHMAAVNALSVHFRVPPREIVFLHRRLAGVFIMLATLGAELDSRELLLETLQRVRR
ncbi:MAG: ABC1 kinase family protein [Stenotrophobium sp.]